MAERIAVEVGVFVEFCGFNRSGIGTGFGNSGLGA